MPTTKNDPDQPPPRPLGAPVRPALSSRTASGLGLAGALLASALVPAPAAAHHEAIFGPQSSLVLSAPSFASVQGYSRSLGGGEAHSQESTVLVSAGVTPVASVPLSLTLVAPMSSIDAGANADSVRGLEDVLLGARYRLDLEGLQQRFGAAGNYLLGMAAVELPTGSVDHAPFDGPLDGMAALMASVEKGRLSAIAYGFYRWHGTDRAGARAGDNVFLGGGLAFTPWDDPENERLLSFQIGASYEIYARDRLRGVPDPATGGRGLYLHPTVVAGPGGHVLLFAMATLPLAQDYAQVAERDRWRVGSGLIVLFR